jgi:thiosulfate/3-mercaptopyruvate sulfurtransferase
MNKVVPIISAKELASKDKKSFVLIDLSYPNGLKTYADKHLAGALFVDLDTDLADINTDLSIGGRHPLTTVEKFVNVLKQLGISNHTPVIIYDRNQGAFGARMWWMFRAVGHENVRVLEGGFNMAVLAGFPVSQKMEIASRVGDYLANDLSWPILTTDEVDLARSDSKKKVVDVRGKDRYEGKIELIDLIAGHIPGAINIPFVENLNADGTFLTPTELREKYALQLNTESADEIIFHCGSGVTACHSILAFELAGFVTPSLYVGSWSEWSRNNKPMIKG